jgi:hypothetical protein
MSGEFKRDLREALAPYSERVLHITTMVQESTPEELLALQQACASVTTTNCGWYEYRAAKLIEQDVNALLSRNRS